MYNVYYTKTSDFNRREWFGHGNEPIPYSMDTLTTTHVAVMSNVVVYGSDGIVANDLERIFADFQADFMPDSRVADWCQWCRNREASHSSMSVGDIVVDQSTGQGWIVVGMGFKPVPVTKG